MTASGCILGKGFDRLAPVARFHAFIAMRRQTGAQEPPDLRLVVDDQNFGKLSGHGRSRTWRNGKRNSHDRADPIGTICGIERAAERLDKAARHRKAQSRTRNAAVGGLGAIEFVEDVRQRFRRDARSLIFDRQR